MVISSSGGIPYSVFDIQVEAMILALTHIDKQVVGVFVFEPHDVYEVDGASGWSDTTTLTLPAYSEESNNQPDLTQDFSQPDSTQSTVYASGESSQTERTTAGFSLDESGLVVGLCGVIVVLSIAFVYTQRTSQKTIRTDT